MSDSTKQLVVTDGDGKVIPEFPETPPREKPKKSDAKPKKLSPVVESPNVFLGTRNLYAALLQAQKDVIDVKKDAFNEFDHYKYVSAEAIIKEARRVLNKNGLMALRPRWWFAGTDGFGDLVRVLVMVFEIRHPESGEVISEEVIFPVIAGKSWPWDKAMSAALTSVQAYWLRDQLQIPRVDASMDNRDDSAFDPALVKNAADAGELYRRGTPIPPAPPPPPEPDKFSRGFPAKYPTDRPPLDVPGTPKPRKANDPKPLPEADKSRAMAGTGKRLGKVPSKYWELKNQRVGMVEGTAKQDLLDQINAMKPHPDAKTRRGDDGWEFYLPTDKAEEVEVSVGSMFKEHDLPESEIAF